MNEFDEHRRQETIAWHERQQQELKKLKGAQNHLWINVVAYLAI